MPLEKTGLCFPQYIAYKMFSLAYKICVIFNIHHIDMHKISRGKRVAWNGWLNYGFKL